MTICFRAGVDAVLDEFRYRFQRIALRQRDDRDRVPGGRDRSRQSGRLASGGLPRIDYVDLKICKLPPVARGQRRMPRQRDPRDLGIADINRPAGSLPSRGQFGGFDGRPGIEIQDAILEILFEHPRKRGRERRPPFPVRKQSEPETGLEQNDAGDPDRFSRLSIQPANYRGVRQLAHQR